MIGLTWWFWLQVWSPGTGGLSAGHLTLLVTGVSQPGWGGVGVSRRSWASDGPRGRRGEGCGLLLCLRLEALVGTELGTTWGWQRPRAQMTQAICISYGGQEGQSCVAACLAFKFPAQSPRGVGCFRLLLTESVSLDSLIERQTRGVGKRPHLLPGCHGVTHVLPQP